MPGPDTSPSRRTPPSWLRTRLSTARGPALVLAVLCFLTAFTAAGLPRVVENYENDALRDMLGSAPRQTKLVSGSVQVSTVGTREAELTRPESVHRIAEAFTKAVRTLPTDAGRAVSGAANRQSVAAAGAGLRRITPSKDPEVTLVAQRDPADHGRLVAGRPPTPRVTENGGEQLLEAAVTRRTAEHMNLKVGDRFRPDGVFSTVVTVTGIVAPHDADALYWNAAAPLAEPVHATRKPDNPLKPLDHYWHFGALVHAEAAPALLVLTGDTTLYWKHPLARDSLRAHDVDALRTGLTSLENGPKAAGLTRVAGSPLSVDDRLGALLRHFERDRSAVAPLLAMAAAGVATAAGTVLLLWSVLTAERRRDELDLLRSRGDAVSGLAGRLLAENAVPGLPAAAAGCALALVLTPGARTAPALTAAGVATAVGLFTLPLRAGLVHRRPLAQVGRGSGPGGGGGRRRLVAEATVLVLVAGAVVALRQRGAGDGTEADPLPAAAPVLLSVAAALLLLRVFPLPLRLLARAVRHRPGPVAFLGLARAGRAPSAVVTGLPLLSLLVALVVASFGGMVLTGVLEGRERAALHTVGADARVAAPLGLTDGFRSRVRDVPGVRDVSAARLHQGAEMPGAARRPVLTVVEPEAYARLASRTGLGAYPQDALRADGDGAAPALVSPDLAGHRGDTVTVTSPDLEVTVRPTLVRASTPAVPAGSFVIVSREALQKTTPGASGSATEPDTLLLTGPGLDGTKLRALMTEQDAGMSLVLRSEELAAYTDSVLRTGAEDLYLAAVLTALALSALAVVLSLVQTAPERTAVLARLRALGMPRRQGRWLILVEALPLYALTATTGVLLALVSVPLLRPGVDLVALAGTPAEEPVRLGVDALPLFLPACCLLLLTVAALMLQARSAARRTDPRMEST